MRAVNLLPKDHGRARGSDRREPPRHLPVIAGALLGALVLGVLVTMTMSAGKTVSDRRAQLDALNAQVAATPPPQAGPPAQDAALTTQRTQRAAALSGALSRRVAWDRVLRRFSLVLPDDVWLTGLTLSSPTPATSPAGTPPNTTATGFTMTGFTYSHDAVARLLSRLQVVPDLAGVQLQSSTRTKLKGREVVSFSIAAAVRTGSLAS
ncbi:MAG TPA: PilN domain-containing protein [Gaiellaceae bacterium]|nr:PilN domain-containing protein [Gaiellaceae bacterium]